MVRFFHKFSTLLGRDKVLSGGKCRRRPPSRLVVEILEDRTAPATFQGLGYFPNGFNTSFATAVSGDGSTVIGDSFYWTASAGFQSIPGYQATSAKAEAVSADGSVIAGRFDYNRQNQLFLATRSAGYVPVAQGPLQDAGGGGDVSGISADGSVVTGNFYHSGGPDDGTFAYHWTASSGFSKLPHLPNGGYASLGYGISSDGNVVVGFEFLFGATQWIASTNSVELLKDANGNPIGNGMGNYTGVLGAATAASADGSVVVGNGKFPVVGGGGGQGSDVSGQLTRTVFVPFDPVPRGSAQASVIFTNQGADLSGPLTFTFNLPGCVIQTLGASAGTVTAMNVTADGKGILSWNGNLKTGDSLVINVKIEYPPTMSLDYIRKNLQSSVDVPNQRTGNDAFRWTKSTSGVDLGVLPGDIESYANSVSADGSIIVGAGTTNIADFEIVGGGATVNSDDAFIWDAAHGMRNLQTLLESDPTAGPALAGWTLTSATSISADGLTVVGIGKDPQGNKQGWIAHLNGLEFHSLVSPEETFAIHPDNTVYGQRIDANGNPVGNPYLVAFGSLKSISVTKDASGNRVLFGIDPYLGHVWELKFDANGNPTSHYYSPVWTQGAVESIAVGHDGLGSVVLFAVDPFMHHVWSMKFDAQDNPAGPFRLISAGGVATSLTVGHDGKGNPLLFTIDPYFSQVQEVRFSAAGDAVTDFYRPAAAFAVKSIGLGYDASGNPELTAVDPYFGHVFYLPLDGNGVATSTIFLQAGTKSVASITPGHDANNDPLLFAIGQDHQTYELKFDSAGKPMGDFVSTGPSAVSVTSLQIGYSETGAIQLFAIGLGDNQVYEEAFDDFGHRVRSFFGFAPGAVIAFTLS
jgi:uncharacterized membrane protein